jgi:hypothetical protein
MTRYSNPKECTGEPIPDSWNGCGRRNLERSRRGSCYGPSKLKRLAQLLALSITPLACLGITSYSIYLWQQFFIQIGEGSFKAVSLCVALPAFTLMSYFWIERPCIRLGYHLSTHPMKV